MKQTAIYTALTRIAPLDAMPWTAEQLPRSDWERGDYIVCTAEPRGIDHLELTNGRMRTVRRGDFFVGALGERRATVEATGTWEAVGDDLQMDVLTSGGLLGKLVSRSPFLPEPMGASYVGHLTIEGEKATMRQFVQRVEERAFETPVVLMIGSSMSAGKTAAGRAIVSILSRAGLRVLGAKLTGAGRYQDTQALGDAGAEWIYDFVDVGLPSTVCPGQEYSAALTELLSMMARHEADVAVIEIGASPLEPYNGVIAIDAVRDLARCTVLAASDPYAAFGVMHAFDAEPDFVCGPAVNTDAGAELVEKLCAKPAINPLVEESLPELERVLRVCLDL